MKINSLSAALGFAGVMLLCSATASAQPIPGHVAKGEPGWSCSAYKFVPGQQWVCSQWSFLGDRKLAPPPGFTDQAVIPEKKAKPQKSKPRKKRRR